MGTWALPCIFSYSWHRLTCLFLPVRFYLLYYFTYFKFAKSLFNRTLSPEWSILYMYIIKSRGRRVMFWFMCVATGEPVTRKMRYLFIKNTSETWCRRWRSWNRSFSHCSRRRATVDWRSPGRKYLRWACLNFVFLFFLFLFVCSQATSLWGIYCSSFGVIIILIL